MQNGSNHRNQGDLVEFIRIGLIHSPSGRLLTSETFQGSLNVSGVSLKRKQIWILYTDTKNPTAFFLQNHLGNFLSADHNGKVTLVSEGPGMMSSPDYNSSPSPSPLIDQMIGQCLYRFRRTVYPSLCSTRYGGNRVAVREAWVLPPMDRHGDAVLLQRTGLVGNASRHAPTSEPMCKLIH